MPRSWEQVLGVSSAPAGSAAVMIAAGMKFHSLYADILVRWSESSFDAQAVHASWVCRFATCRKNFRNVNTCAKLCRPVVAAT